MGSGHKANIARRWPAGRLSAPARATEGNAYGKDGTKAHKTDDKEIRNPLEAAAEGEGGQTALRSMTIGDQSASTCQEDLATNWQPRKDVRCFVPFRLKAKLCSTLHLGQA